MEGYKTIVTNAVVLLVALAAMFGIVIDVNDTAAITAGVLAIINIALRLSTRTPVAFRK